MQVQKKISVAMALLLLAGSSAFSASAPSKTAAKSAATKASSSPSKSAVRSSGGKSGASKSVAKRGRRRRERGQKAPTADRITEIQQALAKDGRFTGKPNGKWDASTIEAMRKFQEAHGLNPTGKLDALTLQKLGLGSQTAGVAAPLPPVNSSLNSNPAGNPSITSATEQPAHPEL